MEDWNHDGKIDSQDSSIFHNVINSDENTPSSGGGNSGCGTVILWIIGVYLFLALIAKLS